MDELEKALEVIQNQLCARFPDGYSEDGPLVMITCESYKLVDDKGFVLVNNFDADVVAKELGA